MSGLGPRTKKVNTYGKKRTGVVSLYRDQDLLTPTKIDHELVSGSETSLKSAKPARAPLTSKLSNDIANLPQTPKTKAQVGKKGSKTISDTGSNSLFLKTVEKPPKLQTKLRDEDTKSSITTKQKSSRRRATKRQVLDGVILPSSKTTSSSIAPSNKATITQITTSTIVSNITDEITNLAIETEPVASTSTSLSKSQEFERLVAACTSTRVHDFSQLLTSPAVSSLLGQGSSSMPPAKSALRKIGEASYSEVFSMGIVGGNKIVIKVIPLVDHQKDVTSTEEAEFPDTSYPRDVLRELEITQRMGGDEGSTSHFVNYLGSYIVKGKYPQVLLDQWWEFKTSLGSSSACPDLFQENQHYALVVLSDAGVDLESFRFDLKEGWKQASSVFWQVANAIAQAEEWTSFEHRDLHEGQILIAPNSAGGVRATIIDFGLSRLSLPHRATAAWSDLPAEVYEGKGDQWDVYRAMRDHIQGDWAGFHPQTNVMWLQYLVRYLLHRTNLRKPRPAPLHRTRRARAPRGSDVLDEGVIAAYEGLRELEEVLKIDLGGMKTAGAVIEWGRGKGFIEG